MLAHSIRHAVCSGIALLLISAGTSIAVAQTQQPQRPAQGQAGQPQEPAVQKPLKGTISEVIRKGKATTLVILSEAGGEPIKQPITPQIQFAVEAKGDPGFLRERQMVSGTGVMTNNLLFVKDWTVHVGLSARKVKPGMQKAEREIGASVNTYQIAGQVQSRQQDKDYPEYETVRLNIPQLRNAPVYIEKNATVTVSMTETDRIAEGAKCEFYQTLGPGNRIRILALKVELPEELKSEEFFAAEEKKR